MSSTPQSIDPAGIGSGSWRGECQVSPSVLPAADSSVLELLQPGTFVKLRNQPEDLPPFQLIGCRGGRCWVRQQAWGRQVHWEVAHRRLTAAA